MKKLWQKLFESNRFVKIVSLILAFVIWVVVATAVEPGWKYVVKDVPINLSSQPTSLSRQELSVISVEPETVDVEVYGKRYVVGRLSPEDLTIIPQFTSITGAGTQDLRLVWVPDGSEGDDYTVQNISPSTASVRVDRMDTKVLDIQTSVTGVDVPEGYIKEDEIVTPERVTLTGPIGDLNRVAHAFVNIEVNKSLTSTETATGTIVLVDQNGNEVTSEYIQKDYDTAEVTIPVLKEKTVPLKIDFLNKPQGFPIEELQYTLSPESIRVAGPQTLVESYNEVMLGYVDFKRLGLNSVETFDVQLPSGFDNLDNIQSVSVEFDTEGYDMASFNISEIRVINEPQNYTVTISEGNQRLSNVQIIGPKETLETMTADDLVAEVDMSDREIVTGQIKWPVTIYAPGKGPVWATGDYTTVIQISENSR